VVPAFSTQKAGISGVVKRQEKEIEEVDSLSKQAMGDLEGLMSNAHEVVKVIEKYSKYLESRAAEKEAAGLEVDTDSMYGEKNTMEEILQSIGVVSPVTRLSAGRLYQRQLSGQIADLLIDKFILQKVGGVITLSDLYCLVNRARGTELLSPADFLSACELFNSLNLGIKYKCFPSGVKVVLSSDASNESMQTRMLHIIEERFDSANQGVFAGDVAHDLNISIGKWVI
jgi:ESCRT-II complex subunit VPS36